MCALAAIAHAETRPRYGGAIEASLLGAPATLDPVLAQSHAELTAVDLVFDTLYRIGPNGTVQPHLAAGPPTGDASKVRIPLRHGVRFHDGSELTAADVVSSLERTRTSQARWILAPILALRADGDAIEITLRSPVGDLMPFLAMPATAITKGGRAPGEHPIGSGPFRVERLDAAGKKLTLVAFDDHFAGRPFLDQLALRWYDTPDGEARRFETGEAQVSARGVAAFVGAQPKYRAEDVESPAALLVFVGFGRAHGLDQQPAFRRALDLALARGTLTSINSGERVAPARDPVPVEAGGVALPLAGRSAELDGARAALAVAATRAKELDAANKPALKLEILVDETRADDLQIAERVAFALTKLDIASTITVVAAGKLRERVARGTCDLWIGQLAAPVTAATLWWGAAFAAGGDPWVEQHLAMGPLDLGATSKAFSEHLPIVPLAFRAVRMWHRSDIRGLGFDATGRPAYADVFLFGDPSRTKAKP